MGAPKELPPTSSVPLGGLGRSAVFPDELYPYIGALSGGALKVFLGLLRHWNRELDAAWPSVRTLGRDTGYTTRHVHRALLELQGIDPETGEPHLKHPPLITSKGAHRHTHTIIWSIPARARLAENWHQMRLRLDAAEPRNEAQTELPLMKTPAKRGDGEVRGGADTDVTQTGNLIQTGSPPTPPQKEPRPRKEVSKAKPPKKGGVNSSKTKEKPAPLPVTAGKSPETNQRQSELTALWSEVQSRGQTNVRLKGALRSKLCELVETHGLDATSQAMLGAAGDRWWSGRASLEEYRDRRPMSWRGVIVLCTKNSDLVDELQSRYRDQEQQQKQVQVQAERRNTVIKRLVELEEAKRTDVDLGTAHDFFRRFNADRRIEVEG